MYQSVLVIVFDNLKVLTDGSEPFLHLMMARALYICEVIYLIYLCIFSSFFNMAICSPVVVLEWYDKKCIVIQSFQQLHQVSHMIRIVAATASAV